MREGEHRLGYQDWVAAYGLRHPDPETEFAYSGSQVAEEYLVVEMLVGGASLGGEPAELLIPDSCRKDVLEVVHCHNRFETREPSEQSERPQGAKRRLSADLSSYGDLCSTYT